MTNKTTPRPKWIDYSGKLCGIPEVPGEQLLALQYLASNLSRWYSKEEDLLEDISLWHTFKKPRTLLRSMEKRQLLSKSEHSGSWSQPEPESPMGKWKTQNFEIIPTKQEDLVDLEDVLKSNSQHVDPKAYLSTAFRDHEPYPESGDDRDSRMWTIKDQKHGGIIGLLRTYQEESWPVLVTDFEIYRHLQRKGHGQEIIDGLSQVCLEKHNPGLMIWIRPNNDIGFKFLAKRGFTQFLKIDYIPEETGKVKKGHRAGIALRFGRSGFPGLTPDVRVGMVLPEGD